MAGSYEASIEVMTPARAKKLLASSKQLVREVKVARLAKAMEESWNPEQHKSTPVHLSYDGKRLHNGHHRLGAIVKRGKKTEVYVRYLDVG